MQTLVIFKTLLLLGLLALQLGAENSGKRGKKSKRSQKKTKNLYLSINPALINEAESPQIFLGQSLAPWTYEVSYEKSRIPNYISEAKCERLGCTTNEGPENIGLESKPIFYQVLVLRKRKVKKKIYSFQLEKKTISVGCTCIKPSVISQ